MDIVCKRCSHSIPASDINLETSVAKCSECNAVFDFRNQLDRKQAVHRGTIDPPKGISLQSTLQGLEIVRRWFSSKVIGLLVFCVFWDAFMVVWFGISINEGNWMMAAFGSIHALVGVAITYFMISGFVNRTHIQITVNELSVKHQPMPWPGNKRVPVGEIQQIFCRNKRHQGKNSTYYTYELHFLDTAGKEHKLLPGLEKPEQALYLEQEIEKTLGIQDTVVSGELPRA